MNRTRSWAAALAVAGLSVATAGWAGTHGRGSGYSIAHSDAEPRSGFSYGVLEPGGRQFAVLSNQREWEAIRSRIESDAPVFWFRLDGETWVVRDGNWVDQALEVTRPMRTIGKKQGQLGRRQGEIGRNQGRIGAEQGRVGAEQGALGARLAAINLRLGMRERRGQYSADLEREKTRIERRMDVLADRQRELSRKHSPHSSEQAELGALQAELGELQRKASRRANRELRWLAEEALQEGVAERLR